MKPPEEIELELGAAPDPTLKAKPDMLNGFELMVLVLVVVLAFGPYERTGNRKSPAGTDEFTLSGPVTGACIADSNGLSAGRAVERPKLH